MAAAAPSEPALRFVDMLLRSISELAPAIVEGIDRYRERATSVGPADGYIFAVRDWLAEATRTLERLRVAARN
jgi:hypothetical protein